MSDFKIKTPTQINNQIVAPINLFAVKGKWKMIGSNSLRSTQYGSDYDIETIIKNTPTKTIANHIQDAYEKASKNADYWITDFKCGICPHLQYKGDYTPESLKEYLSNPLIKPKDRRRILALKGEEQVDAVRDLFILRWTPKDVKAGKVKMYCGGDRTLEDALLDKTITKIDLITKVGDQFAEISENYYISVGGKSNHLPTSEEQLREDLEEDIHYYSKMDSFKALKRLFSLLQIEGKKKHSKQLKSLIEFFNGQVGQLNKVRAELTILEKVLESKFRKAKWEDFNDNLQYIKESISKIYKIPLTDKLFVEINNTNPTNALKNVRTLRDYFSEKINAESKDFLRMNI
jgi:hypothetical protein